MTDENVLEWRGCEVIDRDGDKVGTLEEIYVDEQTRRPEWAILKTGFMGRGTKFVPLIGALREGDHVRVRYEKEQVKEAPDADPEGGLSQEDEERVYAHYGLDYSRGESESGLPEGASEELPEAGAASEERPEAGAASEERPHAGAESGAPGTGAAAGKPGAPRLRLKKYVVTEYVPVQREEVRVESEQGDEGGRER